MISLLCIFLSSKHLNQETLFVFFKNVNKLVVCFVCLKNKISQAISLQLFTIIIFFKQDIKRYPSSVPLDNLKVIRAPGLSTKCLSAFLLFNKK